MVKHYPEAFTRSSYHILKLNYQVGIHVINILSMVLMFSKYIPMSVLKLFTIIAVLFAAVRNILLQFFSFEHEELLHNLLF